MAESNVRIPAPGGATYRRAAVLAATALLSASFATATPAASLESIDWSKVPAANPRLFYPAQSSYEWLRVEDHKKASKEVREGEACLRCHKGEQKSLGGLLSGDHRLEPDPIDDKNGYIRISVQAAHDAANLYLRVSWETNGERPQDMGNFIRFDGKKWDWYGNHRQSLYVLDEGQPAISADRLGIMIGDKSATLYPEQGCWMTCHESMTSMEDPADEDEVKAHPVIGALYKQFGISNSTVRKYLPDSRSEGTDWAAVKSEAELKALREKGAFLDLIIWDAALTGPGGFAADFNVLEIKNVDGGTSPLLPNGKVRGGPAYVFDKGKLGYSVLSEADLEDAAKVKYLMVGTNTADAKGQTFKEGDILPAHVIDLGQAKGSAADVKAQGSFADGVYTVLLQRKLDTGNPLDDKALKVGGVYTFGFSVHDDAAGKRSHHVSFPVLVSIGPGVADIQAVTLK